MVGKGGSSTADDAGAVGGASPMSFHMSSMSSAPPLGAVGSDDVRRGPPPATAEAALALALEVSMPPNIDHGVAKGSAAAPPPAPPPAKLKRLPEDNPRCRNASSENKVQVESIVIRFTMKL